MAEKKVDSYEKGGVVKIISQLHKQSGLSYIEILIGIVFSFIVIVQVLNKDVSSSFELTAFANEMANDIRYAQTMSKQTGQRHYFQFVSSGYVVINSSTNQTIINKSIPKDIYISYSGSSLGFNSIGTPYVNTTTPLSRSFVVKMANSSKNTAAIEVTPELGTLAVLKDTETSSSLSSAPTSSAVPTSTTTSSTSSGKL